MRACNKCSNPFPYVCDECAATVHQAMFEDHQALAQPTGHFMPRETAQAETVALEDNVMEQFRKTFVGSGEDCFSGGC